MKPGHYDLPIIWRGSDYRPVIFKWLDGNGNPVDLSNLFPAAYTKDFNLNAQRTDIPNGVTQISLTKEQTLVLNLGVYQWNWLWETIAPPNVISEPLISGEVEVKEPIYNT